MAGFKETLPEDIETIYPAIRLYRAVKSLTEILSKEQLDLIISELSRKGIYLGDDRQKYSISQIRAALASSLSKTFTTVLANHITSAIEDNK